MLQHRYISVYSVASRAGPRVFACYRPTGSVLALGYSTGLYGREDVPPPPALRVSGRSVGWVLTARNESTGEAEGGRETLVKVAHYFPPGTSSYARGWFTADAEQARDSAYSSVGSIAIRAPLDRAWIVCAPPSRRGRKPCSRPGRRAAVWVERNLRKKTRVAVGTDIDPRSLTRRGDRLVWTQGAHRRSVRFSR